jgi:hypothetical protein
MDNSIFNDVSSYLAGKSETWESNGIFLPTSVGVLNIMDFINGGTSGNEGYILFDESPLNIDPSDAANRESLVSSVKQACRVAGIEIVCKGWENDRKKIVFICKRSGMYNPKNRSVDSKRVCITCKPICDEDKCPFNFTISWFKNHQCWGMKFGLGCRFHSGHFPKEEDEVRIMTSALPPEKLQNLKDCKSSHVPIGGVAAFGHKQTGTLLSKGQIYGMGLEDKLKLVNESEEVMQNPVLSGSSPAQRLIEFLKNESDISYVCLYGHEDCNLLTIRKPNRTELQSAMLVNGGVAIQSAFASIFLTVATIYVPGIYFKATLGINMDIQMIWMVMQRTMYQLLNPG